MSLKSNTSGTWREYRYEKIRRGGVGSESVRHHDHGDPLAPRVAREKRGASRLNLSSDKNRSLSSLEEDFIYAAEFGDIPTVRRVLEENANFSVDYSDILGRTPLRLAVGNEHLETPRRDGTHLLHYLVAFLLQVSRRVQMLDDSFQCPEMLATGRGRQVVELLLDRCNLSTIHEALLQAISAGHEQIAETILKHPKYCHIKKENKRFGATDYFYTTTSEDSPFSSDITPLILAAERNQFEIVQLLLLRGETIPKPHHYYCNCQECANKLEFDQLRLAKTRLNAYKGLASGAYISLSSKDPVLTAFELARELRQVAKVEKYYKTDYLALADQLSDYVVKLLDKIRGHDELQVLINKTGADSEQETYELLARLKLAIRYREKRFVAHPSCQQKLVSIWYANLRTLERSNWFKRGVIVILITIFYPVLAICYWFAPKTKSRFQKETYDHFRLRDGDNLHIGFHWIWRRGLTRWKFVVHVAKVSYMNVGDFLRCPCVKFIGQTMSFITFLLMILISTAMEWPSVHKNLSTFTQVYIHYEVFRNRTGVWPPDFVVRTFQPEIIHLLMSIWIVGMVWQEVKQLYGDGLLNYFDSLYNYLDTAVLSLYVASFTLRYFTITMVNLSLEYFVDAKPWNDLFEGRPEPEQRLYWLIADRFYWNSYDPHNVAEAMFALANIISFARVSFVLPANELFGPMQISLARMITDILKFGVIFLVLFLAFLVGLHNLYWYYPKAVRKTVELFENNVTTIAERYFGIPDVTFRTVFWSMLGRGEPSVVELGDYENYFVQNVGYWIFGCYNVAIVIVLLNMLIAMMSRSFDIIQAEADTEWKFARTKLYMEYISGESTLPVPFNIVPSPKCFLNLLQRVCSLFRRKKELPPVGHPGRIKDIEMFPSSNGNDSQIQQGWETPGARNAGIKRFQERMGTTNGFVRNDSDPNLYASENLTYKRVMKRIVKRFIFDTQREDDTKEADIDELKQDISSFRYEMLNQLNVHQNMSQQASERLEHLSTRMEQLVRQQDILLKCFLKGIHSGDFSTDPGGGNRGGSSCTARGGLGGGRGAEGGDVYIITPGDRDDTSPCGSPIGPISPHSPSHRSPFSFAPSDLSYACADLTNAGDVRSAGSSRSSSRKLHGIPEEDKARVDFRAYRSLSARCPAREDGDRRDRRGSEPPPSPFRRRDPARSPLDVKVEFRTPKVLDERGGASVRSSDSAACTSQTSGGPADDGDAGGGRDSRGGGNERDRSHHSDERERRHPGDAMDSDGDDHDTYTIVERL